MEKSLGESTNEELRAQIVSVMHGMKLGEDLAGYILCVMRELHNKENKRK